MKRNRDENYQHAYDKDGNKEKWIPPKRGKLSSPHFVFLGLVSTTQQGGKWLPHVLFRGLSICRVKMWSEKKQLRYGVDGPNCGNSQPKRISPCLSWIYCFESN